MSLQRNQIQSLMQPHSLCECCPIGRDPPRCDRNPFWRWVAVEEGPCAGRSSGSGGDENGGAGPWRSPGTFPLFGPCGWAFPPLCSPRGSLQWRGCRRWRQPQRTAAAGDERGWWAVGAYERGACCSLAVCGPAEGFSRWTAWSSPS